MPNSFTVWIHGRKGNRKQSSLWHQKICCTILITKGVSGHHNGICPAWHKSRNILAHNGFTKDCAIQDIADCPVRRPPHAFEIKLLNPILVWCNGGAFNANTVFFNGIGRIFGNLIIGFIAFLNAKIKVIQFNIQIGQNQLILDHLPDDAGHFIAIKLGNRVFHSKLSHCLLSLNLK